jgi:uracil-DNA glycosylase family 4
MNKKSTYVPPSGSKHAPFIIVGDQPGRFEVMKGRPFVGPAGVELDANLQAAGIARSDCYFTNVIKDVDCLLAHYIEFNPRKGPTIHPEGQEYINELATELNSCTGSIIIALGNVPLFALADRTGVTKWRSSILKPTLIGGNKFLIPSIHPATIIPPKNQYKNKRLQIYDLRRAAKINREGYNPLRRDITIRPTFQQSLQFLKTCELYGLLGNMIAYDIEVDMFNGEMTCISFAYSPTDVISIPLTCEHGDYFTIPQEIEIITRIAEILENPQIPILGQNLSFDCTYMLRKYGIHTTNIHDTMVAQKTLLPDYAVGLHFICSLYTDLPYYKDDGKYWLKGIGNFESGWRYNALDSVVCADAHPKQIEDLIKQHNYSAYERKCKSIPAYVYIMEHGIRINVASMQQAYDEMGVECEETLKELHKVCGFELNSNSPKQVATYFYVTKGLQAYKSKTGGDTTDEKALKRIARKGYKEASLILRLRGLGKERSTFLNPAKVDADGRMRCSYNPVGTRFSRASSSENIFGTGNNLQNQPHRVLTHFLSDPDYVFYGMDLSQAENRIVAYVGRITQMIEAFERKEDIHGLTARIMANIFFGPGKADGLDVKKTLAPIGDGKKSWRDWGKKANHGLNYDLGYKTFSLYNEIPERDGKLIVTIYHRAYPGVRNGFHSYIKACITKNRTLTNLMGRKTVFTDRMDDALFKDGYSCIPQGTVGDVIDQRGLNFIYYNTDPIFRYVELLIQVHDQIGFQIPTPYHPSTPISWKDHSKILTQIKQSLETPLWTHYGLKFIIPVDTTMGICLNKEKGVDPESLSPEHLSAAYDKVVARTMPVVINATLQNSTKQTSESLDA